MLCNIDKQRDGEFAIFVEPAHTSKKSNSVMKNTLFSWLSKPCSYKHTCTAIDTHHSSFIQCCQQSIAHRREQIKRFASCLIGNNIEKSTVFLFLHINKTLFPSAPCDHVVTINSFNVLKCGVLLFCVKSAADTQKQLQPDIDLITTL